MKKKYAVVDIEATGLDPRKEEVTLIGVYHPETDTDYILEKFDKATLKELLADREVIYHNAKFDVGFLLWKYKVMMPVHHDTMVMAYLTIMDRDVSLSLKSLAVSILGMVSWDISLEEKTEVTETAKEYLRGDLRATWELFRHFSKYMPKAHHVIYKRIMMPAVRAYIGIENRGIYLDLDQMGEVRAKIQLEVDEYSSKLKEIADINWGSTQQVAKVLYEQLKLPILKRTKQGKPSTDVATMKELALQSDIPALILKYRETSKSIGTFIDAWEQVHYFGRLYPTFWLTSTGTGRTSCSEPNLQQVPRNKAIRGLFKAPRGFQFVNIDYSQIELRVGGVIADEPTIMQAYRDFLDLHTLTAQSLVGEGNPVTKADRTGAKAVNFGLLYGMLAKGFREYAFTTYGLRLTLQEAEEWRDKFFNTYPHLLTWHITQVEWAKAYGGVSNLFGRFRALPNINSDDKWERGKDERKALNTPVQSTASDIVLSGVGEVYEKLVMKKYRGKLFMVGTVHDSLMFEIADDILDQAIFDIVNILEQPENLALIDMKGVPLKVDVEVGPWGNGVEYEQVPFR